MTTELSASEKAYPLSPTQKMYWMLRQLPGAGSRLNGCNCIYVRGPQGSDSLRDTVDAVLSRHLALRARFPIQNGKPVQYFDQPAPVSTLIDLRGAKAPLAEAKKVIEELQFTPFDLASGPMARASVIAVAPELSIVAWSINHIVTDLQSARILFEDLADHVAREVRPVTWTFLDALVAATADPVELRFPERAAFWQEELRDARLVDLGAPAAGATGVKDFALPVPSELVERLQAAAQARGTTPYALMLGTFGDVLTEVREQHGRAAIGFISANRTPEDANVVGCFAQSLPATLDLSSSEDRVAHARAAVRRALLNAFPLGEITRAVGRMSLFNVMLNDAVPRVVPGRAADAGPSEGLAHVASQVTPAGLPMFGVRRTRDLELRPYVQPMHAFGLDLSVFVTRGRIYGHYDVRRTEQAVVDALVGGFAERLLAVGSP